jgi:hypothetical protein
LPRSRARDSDRRVGTLSDLPSEVTNDIEKRVVIDSVLILLLVNIDDAPKYKEQNGIPPQYNTVCSLHEKKECYKSPNPRKATAQSAKSNTTRERPFGYCKL